MDPTDTTLTEEQLIQLFILRATEEHQKLALQHGRDLSLGMPSYTSTHEAAIARANTMAHEFNDNKSG
jgi:hypothetical protein